MKALCFL